MKKERGKYIKKAEKELSEENFENVIENFEKVIEISKKLGDKEKTKQFINIVNDFKKKLGIEVEVDEEQIENEIQGFLSGLMNGPKSLAEVDNNAIIESKPTIKSSEELKEHFREFENEGETILIDEATQDFEPEQLQETPIDYQDSAQISNVLDVPTKPNYPVPTNIPPVPQISNEISQAIKLPVDSASNINEFSESNIKIDNTIQEIPNSPQISTIPIPKPIQSPPKTPSNSKIQDFQIPFPQNPSIQPEQNNESATIDIMKDSEDIFKRLKKLQGIVSEDSESQIKITPVKPATQVEFQQQSQDENFQQSTIFQQSEVYVEEPLPSQPSFTPEIEQNLLASTIDKPHISIDEETESLRLQLTEMHESLQIREEQSTIEETEHIKPISLDKINVEEISLDGDKKNGSKDEKQELIEMIKEELPKIPMKKIKYIVNELLKRPEGKLRSTWFKVYIHKNKKYK